MEQILDVTIEQISNLGSGIAKVDGMVIFVENTCPKDKVRIQITKKTKTYAIGKLLEILEPSPHRVEPICPMQKVCGACQIQFIDYKYQLELKKQIVEDYARNLEIKVGDTIPSPQTTEYRHKIPNFRNSTFKKNSCRLLQTKITRNS